MITISNPPSKNSQRAKNRQTSRINQGSRIRSKSKAHQNIKINPTLERERKKLECISDRELLGNLQKINQKERRLKILVLLYLSEIDARELYLPMGFSSLFDFCTMHLKYTRATAARRIRSARAAARYPEALELLLSGEINITTLSMISDIIDQDNHGEILSKIRGRSTRQVELLVSTHKPVNIVRDTVRPVCVVKRVEITPEASGSGSIAETNPANPDDENPANSNKLSSSAETDPADPAGEERRNSNKISSSAGTRIILEQRLKLGFSVSPEFMKKYNKIKSLLSSMYPEGIDFETLFEHLMNEYLEKHDPEKKRERRIKRAKSRAQTVRKNHPEKETHSRRIPPATRDRVFARDKGRCTFIGANGKRCDATWDLEIDHVVPFARGGDNSPENLRLLCRKHNIHQAEKIYGGEFMKNHTKK